MQILELIGAIVISALLGLGLHWVINNVSVKKDDETKKRRMKK